ncbi:MAG: site-specific integrase [Bacillota bacterium]|nr:site-specific integrase [Bacillota bacterium]
MIKLIHRLLSRAQDDATLATLLTDWHSRRDIADTTRTIETRILNRHCADPLFQIPIHRLTSEQIEEYLGDDRSTDRIRQMIRTFLKKNAKEDLETTAHLRIPQLREKPRVDCIRKKALTKAETASLLSYFEREPQHSLIYVFALLTGMRQGEILGLTVSDVDLESRSITINKALKRTNQRYLSSVKTPNGNRIIPLAQELIAPLREHIRTLQTRCAAKHIAFTPETLLFQSHRLTPMRSDLVTMQWHKLQDLLGFKHHISFHGLRHSFATTLCRCNVPLKTASTILGHASVTTTANIYAHVDFDTALDAIDSVNWGT